MLSILFLLFNVCLSEHVITPFGRVKKDCVHYAPRGSVVKELKNYTELHHANGKIEKFSACELIDPRNRKNELINKPNYGASNFDLEGWIDCKIHKLYFEKLVMRI